MYVENMSSIPKYAVNHANEDYLIQILSKSYVHANLIKFMQITSNKFLTGVVSTTQPPTVTSRKVGKIILIDNCNNLFQLLPYMESMYVCMFIDCTNEWYKIIRNTKLYSRIT